MYRHHHNFYTSIKHNLLKKYVFLLGIFIIFNTQLAAKEKQLSLLNLPAGFSIEIFADNIESPRQISEGKKYIYTASGPMGEIYALLDSDNDNKIDSKIVLASGLNNSRGVTFKDNNLYFAEVDKIWVIEDIESQLDTNSNKLPEKKLVTDNLPSDAWHGWKWIKHGPDGMLYVPVGAPCNICLKDDPRYASIMRLNEDKWEYVATGVRNSVGFDWHPKTKKLYFTDNGRDWLGDDSPSCELNVVNVENSFYGFPHVHANDVIDPEYGDENIDYIKPVVELGPHVAPTGTAFYSDNHFPDEYQNTLFITLHGSWNKMDHPSGYTVVAVSTDNDGKVTGYKEFITGWLQGKKAWGRPSAPFVMSDGSLLISDDKYDVIYRVTYESKT